MKASGSVALIMFVPVPTMPLPLEVLFFKNPSIATVLTASQAKKRKEIYQASDITEEN